MECEKIMELFHSELVTVNVGPRLFATALEQQGYRTVQVDWRPPPAGGQDEREEVETLGGLD